MGLSSSRTADENGETIVKMTMMHMGYSNVGRILLLKSRTTLQTHMVNKNVKKKKNPNFWQFFHVKLNRFWCEKRNENLIPFFPFFAYSFFSVSSRGPGLSLFAETAALSAGAAEAAAGRTTVFLSPFEGVGHGTRN